MAYQKQVWLENRNKITWLLAHQPLTFQEIIEKTGLSRGVANQHLKTLEKEGIITKIYKDGKILNVLAPAKAVPVLFGAKSFWWALGYKIQEAKRLEGVTAFHVRMERMSLLDLMRRIFARALYGLIKYFETGNQDWYLHTCSPLNINPLMLDFFGFKLDRAMFETSILNIGFMEFHTLDKWKIVLTPEEINEIKKRVKDAFDKEWSQLDALYDEILQTLK